MLKIETLSDLFGSTGNITVNKVEFVDLETKDGADLFENHSRTIQNGLSLPAGTKFTVLGFALADLTINIRGPEKKSSNLYAIINNGYGTMKIPAELLIEDLPSVHAKGYGDVNDPNSLAYELATAHAKKNRWIPKGARALIALGLVGKTLEVLAEIRGKKIVKVSPLMKEYNDSLEIGNDAPIIVVHYAFKLIER